MQIRNKLKVISFTLFILSVSFSCKKKNETQTPATGDPVVSSPNSISTTSVFSGFFTSIKRTVYTDKTSILDFYYSEASFYASPVSNPIHNGIQINSLSHSFYLMSYDTAWVLYADKNSTNLNHELWQISGANGIPSFNFWNNIFPSCDSFTVIPDSVSRSAGLSFNITGVTNVTTSGYEFQLYNGSNIILDLIKPIQNGNNLISISPAELANIDSFEGLTLYVSLANIQNLNFYGKDFSFSKTNQFVKRIRVYP